jgi:hypothetical protein
VHAGAVALDPREIDLADDQPAADLEHDLAL